jgi:hypothetical protein
MSFLGVNTLSLTQVIGPAGAIVAALAGGLVALVSGVTAAYLTQYWTRRREDRGRLLQQKREVCVGALMAWREFTAAEREVKANEIRVEDIRKTIEASLEELSRSEEVFDEHAPGMDEANRAVARRSADHTRDMTLRTVELGRVRQDELIKAKIKQSAATRNLEYWASMLDITCSPDVAATYRAMCDANPDKRTEHHGAFTRAIQGELSREPSAPNWAPAAGR